MDRENKRIINSISWTFLDGFVSLAYALGMILLVGVFLTPAQFGIAMVAVSIMQLIEACYAQGMQESVIRSQSGHTSFSDTAHSLSVLFALIGYAFACAVSFPLALAYDDNTIITLTFLVGLCLPLNALSAIATANYSRKLRSKFITIRTTVTKAAAITTLFITGLMGLGPWCIIWSLLVTSIASFILIGLSVSRYPKFKIKRDEIREILSFGFTSSAGHFFWMASNRIFALLFGIFHGVEALGLFQLAQRLVDELATLLQISVVRMGLPIFTLLRQKKQDLSRAYQKGTKMLNMITAPAYMGLILITPILIPYIFGEEWSNAVPFIIILSLSWIVVFNRALVPVVLKAIDQPRCVLITSAIRFIAAVILVLATSHLHALWGVIAWALVPLVSMPYQMGMIKKFLRIPYFSQITVSVTALLCAAIMYGAGFFTLGLLNSNWPDFINLALIITLAVMIYTALIFAFEKKFITTLAKDFLKHH